MKVAGTVRNWQSGGAQTSVILWVRLPPVPLKIRRVVFPTVACKAVVTKQAGWTTRGSIPSRPNPGEARVGARE